MSNKPDSLVLSEAGINKFFEYMFFLLLSVIMLSGTSTIVEESADMYLCRYI